MTTIPFADRLSARIKALRSVLVAGLDPMLDELPGFATKDPAADLAGPLSDGALIFSALTRTYEVVLEELQSAVAAIKPNLAFFEQYGVAGMRAYSWVVTRARELGIVVIADAKRGDIGSTAKAYGAAFLKPSEWRGVRLTDFEADAMTINPFLGFDTVEEFLKDCEVAGKGIFVLTKTSNAGSAAIQDQLIRGENSESSAVSVSQKIAAWIGTNAPRLRGSCGLSGLGAVVGATYPSEARELRKLMPESFFLIPGVGAQGASIKDALAGFAGARGGVINLSRGLFKLPNPGQCTESDFRLHLREKASVFNREVADALGTL